MNYKQPSAISIKVVSRSFKTLLFGAFLFASAEYYTQIYNIDIKMVYKDTEENRSIITHCKEIRNGVYRPTFYLPTASLQIIYGAKFDPTPFVPFERELVKLPDQGEIALDWGPIHKSYEGTDPKKMRIVLISHGLTGGSETNYIRHAVLNASRHGFRPVVYHNRGINSELKTMKYHDHADIEDIKYVLEHLQKENPEAAIYGLGISMGANMVTKYAGETAENCVFKGLVSISNPYNLYECSNNISRFSRKLYNYTMTQGFIRNFKKNLELLRLNQHIDIDNALKSTTTKEYDEYVTRRLFGFHNVDEYYKSIGCLPKISNIKIPGLFIHSLDDPICDKKVIPVEEFKKMENLMLLMTKNGGHIDWFTTKSAKRWVYWPALQYLNYIDKRRKGEFKTTPKKELSEIVITTDED